MMEEEKMHRKRRINEKGKEGAGLVISGDLYQSLEHSICFFNVKFIVTTPFFFVICELFSLDDL